LFSFLKKSFKNYSLHGVFAETLIPKPSQQENKNKTLRLTIPLSPYKIIN